MYFKLFKPQNRWKDLSKREGAIVQCWLIYPPFKVLCKIVAENQIQTLWMKTVDTHFSPAPSKRSILSLSDSRSELFLRHPAAYMQVRRR